jgi:hypothetical protein
MVTQNTIRDIKNMCNVEDVSETYEKPVEITDLRDELGTKGHVLVIRGDLAYADRLGDNRHLANPKFWMYETIINSPRIQEQLAANPNHRLFDGVGFSGLDALCFHANKLGRELTVVKAHELIPDDSVFKKYPNVEVVHGDGPGEQGYVEKQEQVLGERGNLIPLHQSLYGAKALAPFGNNVAKQIEELGIALDETHFVISAGSNIYGIGRKIKQKFPDIETVVVEPERYRTIDPDLDLNDEEDVKNFARTRLDNYSLDGWDHAHPGIFPLHVRHLNRYLLVNWRRTGETGIDRTVGVPIPDVLEMQERLVEINPDYNWTKTTALALVPAIESAKKGRNVLAMAYGKYRNHKIRGLIIDES